MDDAFGGGGGGGGNLNDDISASVEPEFLGMASNTITYLTATK